MVSKSIAKFQFYEDHVLELPMYTKMLCFCSTSLATCVKFYVFTIAVAWSQQKSIYLFICDTVVYMYLFICDTVVYMYLFICDTVV